MVGVVLGSFSPLHQGHMDLIYASKKKFEKTLIAVCGYPNDKGEEVGLPLDKRVELISYLFGDTQLVDVVKMCDNEIGIAGHVDKWDKWLASLEAKTGYRPAEFHFFLGEAAYYKELHDVRGLSASLVKRELNPISATLIRSSPMKYWDYIAWVFRKYFQKKILLIGTASEGKTELTKDLCNYFTMEGTMEYGHEALEERVVESSIPTDTNLTEADFKEFLDVQFRRNTESSMFPTKLRICDSDANTTLMYARDYAEDERYRLSIEDYKKLVSYAEQNKMFIEYALILVLPPKGKFVRDGTRDELKSSIAARETQYQMLMEQLQKHYGASNMVFLNGGYEQNFYKAKQLIQELLDE